MVGLLWLQTTQWQVAITSWALWSQGPRMPWPLNSALSSCSTKYLLNEWLKTEGGAGISWSHKNPSCSWADSVIWTVSGGRREWRMMGGGERKKGQSQGRIWPSPLPWAVLTKCTNMKCAQGGRPELLGAPTCWLVWSLVMFSKIMTVNAELVCKHTFSY